MSNLMLDLETLSTRPNAVFTQIGWAEFDERKDEPVMRSGNIRVDAQSCIDAGLVMDWGTVSWWLNQSDAARQSMRRPGDPLCTALASLIVVVSTMKPYTIWANAPSFDLAILENAYRTLGMGIPWNFWQQRCQRTLLGLYPDKTLPKIEPTVAHDAEADAISQALRVSRALHRHTA